MTTTPETTIVARELVPPARRADAADPTRPSLDRRRNLLMPMDRRRVVECVERACDPRGVQGTDRGRWRRGARPRLPAGPVAPDDSTRASQST